MRHASSAVVRLSLGLGLGLGLGVTGSASATTAGVAPVEAIAAPSDLHQSGPDYSPWRQAVAGPRVTPAVATIPEAPVSPAAPVGSHVPPPVAARPAVAPAAPPPPAPRPGPRHDWLEAPSIGLSVAVSIYSDCQGATPLTRASAARDTCVPAAEVFLVGHRPGPFGSLPGLALGATVTYWDSAGSARTYTIYQQTRVPKSQGGVVMENQHPPLLMQTCDDATGSYLYFYGS